MCAFGGMILGESTKIKICVQIVHSFSFSFSFCNEGILIGYQKLFWVFMICHDDV